MDNRFQPEASSRLEEIVNKIQSTLLDAPPPGLEAYGLSTFQGLVTNGETLEESWQHGAGVVEEDLIHEAEYGAGKEDGVGEEKEGDMD